MTITNIPQKNMSESGGVSRKVHPLLTAAIILQTILGGCAAMTEKPQYPPCSMAGETNINYLWTAHDDFDLSGRWQVQPIATGAWDSSDSPAGQGWTAASVPAGGWQAGPLEKEDKALGLQDGDGVWVQRQFDLAAEQASQDAVLRWEIIRWGFAAWINGAKIGETELYSPGFMPVPAGLLKGGTNSILLKVRNLSRVARAASGYNLVPVGSARFNWGAKKSYIGGHIGLDLFRSVRIRSVLMKTDLRTKTITASVKLDCVAGGGPVKVSADIFDASGRPVARAAGDCADMSVSAAFELSAAVAGIVPWTPKAPYLYTANIAIADSAGQTLDNRFIRFGAREFQVHDGFLLNGRPFNIRGSDLLQEWLWKPELFCDHAGAARKYFIEAARGMNVNAFRTHTLPPPHRLADMGDAFGMLLLAEMPMTYNYHHTGMTEQEDLKYCQNGLAMTLAWVEELGNHPSIVIWVPTNEPTHTAPFDLYDWQEKVFAPAVKRADPTRPIMFAGDASPEIDDVHIYEGFWGGSEGDFYQMAKGFADARKPGRALFNSEYLEGMPEDRCFRWTGSRQKGEQSQMVYAMFGMEQTEGMRVMGYDGVLPYMFASWSLDKGPWRPGLPTPMYAALRNALAPTAAILDRFDRNAQAGSRIRVDVMLINDEDEPFEGELSLMLCDSDPEFQAGLALSAGDCKSRRPVRLAPRQRRRVSLDLDVPAEEKSRHLAAVLSGPGRQPVLSQRFLRAIAPTSPGPKAAERKIQVIGADDAVIAMLRSKGLDARHFASHGRIEPEKNLILVWENCPMDVFVRYERFWINKFLHEGGRMVILRQPFWQGGHEGFKFPALPDGTRLTYECPLDAASTAYRTAAGENDPLWRNFKPEYLQRWNGFGGTVCRESIKGAFVPGCAPAITSESGFIPASPGCILIEGGRPVRSNFIVDVEDARFVEKKDGRLVACPMDYARFGRPSLLCTKTKPDQAYEASYDFDAEKAVRGQLWTFENGRAGSSTFRWRIDDGPWNHVTKDTRDCDVVQARKDQPVWFAWTMMGAVDIQPGRHTLQIAVDEPLKDGLYLLSQDSFLIAPPKDATVLAVSGSNKPVIVDIATGRGGALICQLLLAARSDKSSPCYDPAAERLFLNMLDR